MISDVSRMFNQSHFAHCESAIELFFNYVCLCVGSWLGSSHTECALHAIDSHSWGTDIVGKSSQSYCRTGRKEVMKFVYLSSSF